MGLFDIFKEKKENTFELDIRIMTINKLMKEALVNNMIDYEWCRTITEEELHTIWNYILIQLENWYNIFNESEKLSIEWLLMSEPRALGNFAWEISYNLYRNLLILEEDSEKYYIPLEFKSWFWNFSLWWEDIEKSSLIYSHISRWLD